MRRDSILYRLLVAVMSVVVMLSAVSASFKLHFCNNQLKSISLQTKEMPCCQNTTNYHLSIHKKMKGHCGCCANKIIKFAKIQETPAARLSVFKGFSAHLFTIISSHINTWNCPIIEDNSDNFYLKAPPIRPTRSINILVEQFLC